MGIDFHAPENRGTYATRSADGAWLDVMKRFGNPRGKRVVDIGCGGGIYTRAWLELGAASVTGVDFSEGMVRDAREQTREFAGTCIRQGDVANTGLPSGTADIVFERALIHHIVDLAPALREARRLLHDGGLLIIQDRTTADVAAPPSEEHFRGYFFEVFPRLFDVEARRRPDGQKVQAALEQAGFAEVQCFSFWEPRATHANRAILAEELLNRTGRSLLHELSDTELGRLVAYVLARVPAKGPIREIDRWTVWSGVAARRDTSS